MKKLDVEMTYSPYFIVFLFLIQVVVAQNDELTGSRIVGGTEAQPNEFPYMVSIQQQGKHTCGGAIISQSFVLTTASCVNKKGERTIVAGQHDFRRESGKEQRKKVQEIIIHERFNDKNLRDDIALIIVDSPFTLNNNVKSATLPIANQYPRNNGVVMGWGSTSRILIMPNLPDVLQKATFPIHSQSSCRVLLRGDPRFTDKHICAGPLTGRSAVCNGDGGSPLVQQARGKNDVIVGLVSYSSNFCGTIIGIPDVFVQVSKYIDWIAEKYEKSLVNV